MKISKFSDADIGILCRWLSVRLETLGALSAFSAALLAVEQAGSASSTGLSLSYALQITQLTNMTVRLASLAENAFNAVGEQQKPSLPL